LTSTRAALPARTAAATSGHPAYTSWLPTTTALPSAGRAAASSRASHAAKPGGVLAAVVDEVAGDDEQVGPERDHRARDGGEEAARRLRPHVQVRQLHHPHPVELGRQPGDARLDLAHPQAARARPAGRRDRAAARTRRPPPTGRPRARAPNGSPATSPERAGRADDRQEELRVERRPHHEQAEGGRR
jgi:hypothetical protein